MNTCHSCRAPIRWVITEQGRRMPIDVDPHPAGNVIPIASGDVGPRARVLAEPPVGQDAWRSHFATCPHAGQHRR